MTMRVLIASLFAAVTVASARVSAGEFVAFDSGIKPKPVRLIGYLARSARDGRKLWRLLLR
jgi:hypothetical protein